MDKKQAEVVAQVLLEPQVRAQDDLRLKREREAARLKGQRRIAWLALAGSSLGGGIAYVLGEQVAYGAAIGAVAAASLGWFFAGQFRPNNSLKRTNQSLRD